MADLRVPITGSARVAHPAPQTPLDPTESVEFSVVLRRRAEIPETAFAGPPLTRAELAERYGADPDELAAVRAALEAAGATVASADPATRVVRASGAAAAVAGLFGTTLASAQLDGSRFRVRAGELSLPAALAGPVLAVLGLDERPQARAHLRIASPHTAAAGLTPLQVAQAYRFPDGTDGSGQTIAIVELGGGFAQSDLDSYFGGLGLSTPNVQAVAVDGAANQPGQDPQGADGEVLLDIEVAGAVAPAASVLVYFAPNTDAGFLDAVAAAAHATPAPTAISISWGQSEDQWTGQARSAMDAAFADADLLGVTVSAAAGDSGSTDNDTSAPPHVDFPASSPHVLACGGTKLTLSASGEVADESVWNEGAQQGSTGGGVSDAFALPTWQASAGVPSRSGTSAAGRGVPDVAGDADPQTGYEVLVDGSAMVIGGTSAVAPLWAGLIARLAQALGRPLGLLQPALYAGIAAGQPVPGFRDVTSGDNGAYEAGPGWDACTGCGSPDGAALLDRLRSSAT